MIDVSHSAMNMALEFLHDDKTVTVDGLISTAEKIREFLGGASNDAAPTEEAPKGRRRTAAKTTGETETGAASEPAPSDKPRWSRLMNSPRSTPKRSLRLSRKSRLRRSNRPLTATRLWKQRSSCRRSRMTTR